MKNEINNMILFSEQFDFVRVQEQGCYFEESWDKITLNLMMDQYTSDLANAVKGNPKSGALYGIWVADLFFKIVSSVKKIHNTDRFHFDLKLENIFMMNQFTPVIGDLGLMMTGTRATKMGLCAGSPLYLGEKVARGFQSFVIDSRLDLYALGVILYLMIT